MIKLLEMVVGAIALYVGAGYMIPSALWWVGLICGAFAVILTLGVIGEIGGN